ncbi:hypothetical protein GYN07_21745 [Rhizobium leguminosarum bv. viciae 248]|uniref:hypothetical protein n=1 Tax=Rhizobium leguminosarum TaxID=384 RepID=UPI0012BB9289|nr:hypothetical protein [Rhizobium leguminosarum]NKM62379.1 hypothetical protein [Rhizobium leguminosarum bv. viciae]QHW27597.1 hypothetical protein GYN07_21745 [Rhizobium leguminosarum bv. viciae 248]
MQRIVNINRESLHAFIRDNTAVGSLLVTDGNTAYRRSEDRGHQTINLSAVDAPPAHEVLPWVHRLWRDVVGDTRQWKHKHEDQFLDWSGRTGWIAPKTTRWKLVATSSTRSTISGAKRRDGVTGEGNPGVLRFRPDGRARSEALGDTSIRRALLPKTSPGAISAMFLSAR